MSPRNFLELQEKMSRQARARSLEKAKKMIAEMPLDQLRTARRMTQNHLARLLRVNQAAISKMEHRSDMYISTLADFIRAMGGELEIRAVFPDGTVKIKGFGDLKQPA